MFGNRNRSRFWVHSDLVFTVAQPNDSATFQFTVRCFVSRVRWRQVRAYRRTDVSGRSGQGGHSGPGGRGGRANRELRTVNREPLTANLLPVRYPNVLHLRGVPEELFALTLFGGEPVSRFTVGDPGRFQVAG